MRFRRYLEIERGQKEIDITPLVDMVFQLLIFFMLTSSFVTLPGIKINLPKAQTAAALPENNIVITVGQDKSLFLNETRVTAAELRKQLAQRVAGKQDTPLLIKADTKADIGTVVEIWDICRVSGISQINIATLQESPAQ